MVYRITTGTGTGAGTGTGTGTVAGRFVLRLRTQLSRLLRPWLRRLSWRPLCGLLRVKLGTFLLRGLSFGRS